MRSILFLLILAVALMLQIGISDVTAARHPNSVEKTIIYRGDKAREIGLLLGFDDTRDTERLYRLGKNDTWALALREHPGDYDAAKAANKDRFNRVRYLPQPEPCLIIEGNWLDNTTGTGTYPPLPRYIFSSPPISENSGDAEWRRLLQQVLPQASKLANNKGYWETVSEKKIYDKPGQVFSITIYKIKDTETAADRRGYVIIIGSEDNKLK